MTTVYWFIGILLLPVLFVCNVPVDPMKRTDKNLEQFTSAINAALRLRYGKRSENPNLFSNKIVPLPEKDKLSQLANRVVASLNEAERLRFG
ncbi:unnamed protein product [Acanthocheilonema viteae]|uniref:Uncharacterized protein n=1 Tax=Acanthocheilonema viteae TaxID=6277 RepID=A0A498S7I9_ACAVI|nr:unnamed protein product [Acanthocheilonema viteae]